MTPENHSPAAQARVVDHYENFPVASWLCPPHLRPVIAAIYWFARTGDDLADEGEASASHRLADLARFRDDLRATAQQQPTSGQWPGVFQPLGPVMREFKLPTHLLEQLLDAFEQDVCMTAAGQRFATEDALLDYCSRSANPVGRLLLHLYGVVDAYSLAQSDQICTALQLINFWQDLSVDLPRQRWYPTQANMQRFGVQDADLQAHSNSPQAAAMVAHYVEEARHLMRQGAPLACRLPGRAGWELRLVVQGGLRLLDKIEALQFATWRQRPKVGLADLPTMLWRAWRMR